MNEQQLIQQQLDMFEKSIGQRFRLVGHGGVGINLTDAIQGVDRNFEMVRGARYGDFHVSLVRLIKQSSPQIQML